MVFHDHDSRYSPAGFPDLVLIKTASPDAGRLIFAELKSSSGKVSVAQELWLDMFSEGGQETYLWRPSDVEQVVQVLSSKPKVLRSWRDWLV